MSPLGQKIKVVEDAVVVVVVVDEEMVGGETIIKVAVKEDGEEEVRNSRRRLVTQGRRTIVIPILPMVPLLYPPFILAILRWKSV